MRLDNRSCNLHDLTTGAVHWSAVCTSMDFVFFWIPCDNVQVLDYTLSKACWSPHLSPQSSMSWLFYCILSSMAPGHISIRLSASRCLGWVGMWKGGGGLLNQVVFFLGGGVVTLLPCHIPFSIRFIREWLPSVFRVSFLELLAHHCMMLRVFEADLLAKVPKYTDVVKESHGTSTGTNNLATVSSWNATSQGFCCWFCYSWCYHNWCLVLMLLVLMFLVLFPLVSASINFSLTRGVAKEQSKDGGNGWKGIEWRNMCMSR